MEAELRRLRHREAEDAKTLETMVQHVEANLKRTTVRFHSIHSKITMTCNTVPYYTVSAM